MILAIHDLIFKMKSRNIVKRNSEIIYFRGSRNLDVLWRFSASKDKSRCFQEVEHVQYGWSPDYNYKLEDFIRAGCQKLSEAEAKQIFPNAFV